MQDDFIFQHSYEPLECMPFHRISPEKARYLDDLGQEGIIRNYDCFEANDIEGFLFFTPPTILDEDQASIQSQISDAFSHKYSKFSSTKFSSS